VARFESDGLKHIPDHGAKVILEEYIARSKVRIQQLPKHEGELKGPGAESSSTQTLSPTGNAGEQQVLAAKVSAELEEPERVTVLSYDNPIPTSFMTGIFVQLSPASKQTIKSQVWAIADEIWDRKRQAECAVIRQYDQFLGESSVLSSSEFFARDRTSLINSVRRSRRQRT
jgi:hypothetical protein